MITLWNARKDTTLNMSNDNNLQWDVGLLRKQLFSKLNHAEDISLPFYNSVLDQLEIKTVTIPSDCILIVEGVFLQRPEWRDFFEFIVYLDCPREKTIRT